MADWRILRKLWQAAFWVSFPFGILSFVLPIYGKELGATALEVGGFFSAISLVPVLVRPFLGRMLDRWGRRPFLLLGLGSYVVAMVLFYLADTVWLLTAGRFIQGIGQAFLWLSAYTIVADVAAEAGRGHEFGLIDEAASRGAIIGTTGGFVALFALESADLSLERTWSWLFAAYTLPALLALWSGWRGVEETRPQAAVQPVESRPLSGQLLALMGIVFVTGASTAMVWPLLMIFLQDALQADVAALAIAYLPAALLSAFLPSRLGRIADRLGRKGPMVAGLLLGALASALIPHLRSLLPLAGLWAVESLGYAASVPAERAFVADIAGEDTRGTSYGLYTFAYFLGAAIGPFAGGWLYDHAGHATPFYLNTFVLLIGALLVVAMLREQPATNS
ncbi:MAG TPA: MFS transporter [Anaerolineales bacterium]|nr:MFS transporter [Anaerolineae bacterium]HIQ01402.1 MFS transporter [Anaerolineales bacterium]